MDRPLIVATNRIHDEVAELLRRHGRLVVNTGEEPWPPERLLAEIADAAAVMTFMPDIVDAAFLDGAPRLEIVSCALKGFDNFDVDACTGRGVWVSIVEDLLTDPTAELAIGLTIALARHVMAGDRHVRQGYAGWRPRLYGTGLAGSRIGILGMGAIGRAVARRLSGFGCEIVYWDRQRLERREEAELGIAFAVFDELVAGSAFLLSALPLTSHTRHLIDAEVLAAMPPGAFLINPSRGSVVDEAAVADALDRGHLAGYAADVFEMEDWALADRPRRVEPRLLAMPERTLFTPHLGSAVREVRFSIERDAAENIIEALQGRRPHGSINSPKRRPERASA